jgi:hypothetical protein
VIGLRELTHTITRSDPTPPALPPRCCRRLEVLRLVRYDEDRGVWFPVVKTRPKAAGAETFAVSRVADGNGDDDGPEAA